MMRRVLLAFSLVLAAAPAAAVEAKVCAYGPAVACTSVGYDACSPWDDSCCEALGDECPIELIPWVLWGRFSGEEPAAYCIGPEEPKNGGLPNVVVDVGAPCEGAPTRA